MAPLSKRLSLPSYTAWASPPSVKPMNYLYLTLSLTATYFSGIRLQLHLTLDCCMVSLTQLIDWCVASLTQLIDCCVASRLLRVFEIKLLFKFVAWDNAHRFWLWDEARRISYFFTLDTTLSFYPILRYVKKENCAFMQGRRHDGAGGPWPLTHFNNYYI